MPHNGARRQEAVEISMCFTKRNHDARDVHIAIGLALATAALTAQSARPAEPLQVAALRRMITTVNAGDAAGYAGLYSADAVITIYGGERLSGRPAIERYEAALMQEFPG